VLRARITGNISEIPAADWHKVFPDVLENYDLFKTVEESGITQFSFYHIMVYDKKEPVGAATCFLVDYSLDTSVNGPIRRITNSIKKLNPNIFSIKALVCGTPMTPGRIGLAGDRSAVFRVMLRKIEQLAKKKKAAIVAFKDFDRSFAGILDPLRKEGFAKFDSLPNTELNIGFRDFEGYLKTLSGATRYDLRRKFKKVDGRVKIDMKVVDSPDPEELKDVYKMYLDIVARNDMNFELLPEAFFRDVSKNMPGRVKFFLWRIDGRMAAFLFALVSKERFIDYFVGFDYSIAHKYHLYFLKFRDALNWCIDHKIKSYEMGITAYEPKLRLGFDLVPLYIYAKLRNRMLRPVFNLICQLLKFEHFDPVLRKAKKKNLG
jgi:predicted N-acyltransferase